MSHLPSLPPAPPWTPPPGPRPVGVPVGRYWDVVRVAPEVAEAVVAVLRSRGGPVVQDRERYDWLVPLGTAGRWLGDGWAWALPAGVSVTVPPAGRRRPPGVHWRVPVGREPTAPALLRHAVRLAANRRDRGGARPEPPATRWLPPPGPHPQTVPVGVYWHAVRVPAPVGEAAVAALGPRCGAVIAEPPTYTFLTTADPAGGAGRPGVQPLPHGHPVTVPPRHRQHPPGVHWRVPVGQGRHLTRAALLRGALHSVHRGATR